MPVWKLHTEWADTIVGRNDFRQPFAITYGDLGVAA